MSRSTTTALAGAALAAAALVAAPASAQMTHVPSNDWRQGDRHDAIQAASNKMSFLLSLRFGPYLPNIDSEFKGKTPFQNIFGLDCSVSPAQKGSVSPAFHFGIEGDFLPVRIPYVGAVGPGLSWGFVRFANQAALSDRTGGTQCSAETTALTIMPMYGVLVLHADELMRRTGIPIVPYGKFGAGVAYWRATNDSGTDKICGTATSPAACKTGDTPVASGNGLTPSLHFALGGMLALNFIDPRSSARLDETTGIHHAFLFGEYYNDTLSLGSKVMKVGASSWVVGLAADF
jgi:hypothetical protein